MEKPRNTLAAAVAALAFAALAVTVLAATASPATLPSAAPAIAGPAPTAPMPASVSTEVGGPAQHAPKIYISVDMEGLAGVVTGDQLGPGGFEYERFRRFMTAEVLAAIEGAREAGAGEILVSDSHGNGENLLIEQFPDDVRVVRSWPRSLSMMTGIDETFDGVMFIGYHAGTTNPEGVRAHTMSSATLADIRLNDVSSAEAVINAAIAGHFGVPVILMTGDEAIRREATSLLGAIETVVVKQSHSFHSATTMTPRAALAAIREAARTAVA